MLVPLTCPVRFVERSGEACLLVARKSPGKDSTLVSRCGPIYGPRSTSHWQPATFVVPFILPFPSLFFLFCDWFPGANEEVWLSCGCGTSWKFYAPGLYGCNQTQVQVVEKTLPSRTLCPTPQPQILSH